MTHDLLQALCELIEPELRGLVHSGNSITAAVDARYGRVTLHFDFDASAQSIRIYTAVPPPVGAGPEFLVWCLATNTLYWDVKLGLDDNGMLLVHSDVDLDQADLTSTARVLLERVTAMRELLDDDLVEYLLKHKLGTPAQTQRWLEQKHA
jgi:hypothetical protein